MSERLAVEPATFLRAVEFTRLAGVGKVEEWMCWAGWRLWIACDRCIALGPQASCWGRAGCHSYSVGCGCRDCAERQAQQLADQAARAA